MQILLGHSCSSRLLRTMSKGVHGIHYSKRNFTLWYHWKKAPHWTRMARKVKSTRDTSSANCRPQNPYQYEIIHSNYPPHLFNTDGSSIPPVPLEDNDLIWVDNKRSLQTMLNVLKQANEIAVDLEHHDYRSYYGFVCLMQISTRKQDWIVDTLELREELIALNEVFTDPNIVKVQPV